MGDGAARTEEIKSPAMKSFYQLLALENCGRHGNDGSF
jgi:hypothetical protein